MGALHEEEIISSTISSSFSCHMFVLAFGGEQGKDDLICRTSKICNCLSLEDNQFSHVFVFCCWFFT